MNLASWAGRLFGSAVPPSERNGGNSAWQALRLQLEDLLRPAQVLQPVHTKIPQRRARRQPVAHQRSRRLRHQHLPPVADRRDPGGPVHLQPHQPSSRLLRLAAMHTHPHPDLLPARPRLRFKCVLHLQHRRHARPRRGKHREEPVPLGIYLPAAVPGQRRPDQRMMDAQHPRVHLVPQTP